jgi:integrase
VISAAEQRFQKKPNTKAAVSRFDKYTTYLRSIGPTTNFISVAMFLTHFMVSNHGHTTSLSGVLSHLRSQHASRDLPFLTAREETRLDHLLNQYRREDPSLVRRASPLRTAIVLRIIRTMNLEDPVRLTQATMLLLAVQALLRGGEITNRLKGSDFVFKTKERSVVIHLKPTKTCQTGAGVFLEVADNSSEVTAFKLLERLFSSRGRDLHNHPDQYTFCMIANGKLHPTVRSSQKAFRKLIKSSVASIGLNPDLFNGHSARAGGATDLFAADTPYYVVKKYGRWRSDAALIYYRCESSIAQRAAAAFEISAE